MKEFLQSPSSVDLPQPEKPQEEASSTPAFPAVGWNTLQKARTSCPEFTVQTIMSLFLDTRCSDGEAMANFKAVVGDNKAMRLFQMGYVSKIKLVWAGNTVHFMAQCQPEMQSAVDYKIRFTVQSVAPIAHAVASVGGFLFSDCTCPAGIKGTKGQLQTHRCRPLCA